MAVLDLVDIDGEAGLVFSDDVARNFGLRAGDIFIVEYDGPGAIRLVKQVVERSAPAD